MISAEQCEQIQRETFVAQVESFSTLTSTNDHAIERAIDTSCNKPLLVVAERQTAGRGRGANRWWSNEGALTFSLLLEKVPDVACLPVSLATGVAVCDAIETLTEKTGFGLKWPNDVYVSGLKIAGILVERPAQSKGDVVIGIGLNVNNSMRFAPSEISKAATSLLDVTGLNYELHDVLICMLSQIEKTIAAMTTDQSYLQQRWRQLCILRGKNVVVAAGNLQHVGLCKGIDENGALIIETTSGREKCSSGVVQSFG